MSLESRPHEPRHPRSAFPRCPARHGRAAPCRGRSVRSPSRNSPGRSGTPNRAGPGNTVGTRPSLSPSGARWASAGGRTSGVPAGIGGCERQARTSGCRRITGGGSEVNATSSATPSGVLGSATAAQDKIQALQRSRATAVAAAERARRADDVLGERGDRMLDRGTAAHEGRWQEPAGLPLVDCLWRSGRAPAYQAGRNARVRGGAVGDRQVSRPG